MRKQYLFIWSFSPTLQLSQVLTQIAGSFMPQTAHIQMMSSGIVDTQNQNFMVLIVIIAKPIYRVITHPCILLCNR